jgi:hypothetical protein
MESKEMTKVNALMAALARTTEEVRDCAQKTHQAIAHHSFGAYYAYRDSIAQYGALVATINHRLARLPSDTRDELSSRLLASERELLTITVKSAFDFFFALSAIPILPLGIKEMFTRELASLQMTHARLNSPDHEGQLPPELVEDLEVAEEILQEIMQKAPTLLSFDDTLLKLPRRSQRG